MGLEFVRVAYDVRHAKDGETVMEDVTDAAGHKIFDRGGVVVRRPVQDPDGPEVFESTQRFAKVSAARLAEAVKAFAHVEKIEHTAGGPIVVRVRKGA